MYMLTPASPPFAATSRVSTPPAPVPEKEEHAGFSFFTVIHLSR